MTTSRLSIRPSLPRLKRKGFTLVELLVAITILTLLVAMLAIMTNHVGKLWSGVNEENQRRQTGRAMLQFMAKELQTARLPALINPIPADSATSPVKAAANLQLIANLTAQDVASPQSASIPDDCLNPHAIFWQAPIAINNTKGDLAEIGYFVHWDTTSKPGRALAYLSRFYVDPATSGSLPVYSGSNWTENALAVAPATASGNYKGWLADNVIALFVLCLDSSGMPIIHTGNPAVAPLNNGYGFDSSQGYTDSAGIKHAAPALPPFIRLSVVVVDANTALRITSPLKPVLPADPADLLKDKTTTGSILNFVDQLPASIKTGAQVFSTVVPLQTATN